jgi:hypothetical protein
LRIRVHSTRFVTGKRRASAYRIRVTVSRSLGSQKAHHTAFRCSPSSVSSGTMNT